VKLSALRLVNFRQHADTRVEFQSGITGIIGPNGSGKTTLLEAIAWALYGAGAQRGAIDGIRFLRAEGRSSVGVELDFELGGHRYRVQRGLRRAELFLDGNPVANSITSVNEFLLRRLGMSRTEFFNTYFTGQKELNAMAAMSPAERAQFVSRVLGYEKLKAARDLVRQRGNALRNEITGLRSGMADADAVERRLADAQVRLAEAERQLEGAEARRADADARMRAVSPRWEHAQQVQEQFRLLEAEVERARGRAEFFEREIARFERELAAARTAAEELARVTRDLAPLEGLTVELKRLDKLCAEEGRRKALADQERGLAEEVAKLAERLEKLEQAPAWQAKAAAELEVKRGELAAAEQSAEALRTAWIRDKQEAETKRDTLRKEWQEFKEQRDQIAKLGPESPCPTCGRPLGASFRTQLDELDTKLATLNTDGKYYAQRVTQLAGAPGEVTVAEDRRRAAADEVSKLQRDMAKVQAKVEEMQLQRRDVDTKRAKLDRLRGDLAEIPTGYDKARHDELGREVKRLQQLGTRAAVLERDAGRAAGLEAEQARAAQERARMAAALEELKLRQAEAGSISADEYAALRAEHDAASAQLRQAELGAERARGDVRNANTNLASAEAAKAELERVRARLAGLQAERRLHEELDLAYTDLRDELNMQLRPELSDVAGAFLEELTDGRYSQIELDESYNVVVLEDGLPKPVISGGEEDLANLVLRLAISQMIAERAGQSFSLLVLDEIFGSLDESRRQSVVELLRRLHDRFEQVILITHIESVREGVDHVVAVRYDEERGSSVVTQDEGGGGTTTEPDDDPELSLPLHANEAAD
jgi:DNA repair protein SbcC/Rad50